MTHRLLFEGLLLLSMLDLAAQSEHDLFMVENMQLTRIDTIDDQICKEYVAANYRYTTQICFSDAQHLASCQSFVDGKAYGKFISWYSNGHVKNITFYMAECPFGMSQEFHSNGALSAEGEYYLETTSQAIILPPPTTDTIMVEQPDGGRMLLVTNHPCKGRKEGRWRYYDDQGTLLRSETWHQGMLIP